MITNIQKSQKKDDGRIPSRTVSFRPPPAMPSYKKNRNVIRFPQVFVEPLSILNMNSPWDNQSVYAVTFLRFLLI